MGLSLRPEHLRRYRDIAQLLLRYGRSDLVRSSGLQRDLDLELLPESDSREEDARRFAADLERMGPTYVKLGQLLSTRADLFPRPVLDVLSRLQDELEPMPFEDVERVVTEELGVRMSKAFDSFETEPMAAASLGQVHRARLRDGREVAVKVQRIGIREHVAEDLEALDQVTGLLDRHTDAGERYRLAAMFDQFREVLLRELDYRVEANNMRVIAENLADVEDIVVPLPVDDYTTGRVLTMDYVRGRKVTKIGPLTRLHSDGAHLADQLFRAYMKQVLVDGLFHADPHPGNIFLTHDGKVALLDLGMVQQLTPRVRENLVRLVLATSEGAGDDAAEHALRMSRMAPDAERDEFHDRVAALVSRQRDARGSHVRVGQVLLELFSISGQTGVHLPPELSLLGKTMLNLDEVALTLDPEFDPNGAVQRHAAEIMQQHMRARMSPTSLMTAGLETMQLIQRLPAEANRALDLLGRGEVRLRVQTMDEERLMRSLRGMANRITLGLLLAALIVGAALMSRVETTGRIFGYPAIAFVIFMIAAIAAAALAVRILWFDHDEPHA